MALAGRIGLGNSRVSKVEPSIYRAGAMGSISPSVIRLGLYGALNDAFGVRWVFHAVLPAGG